MKNLLISLIVGGLCSGVLVAQKSNAQTMIVPNILYPDTDHGTCSIGLQVNPGGAELRSGPGEVVRQIRTA